MIVSVSTRREFRKLGLGGGGGLGWCFLKEFSKRGGGVLRVGGGGGGGNEIQVAVLMKHSLECLMIYLIASCQTCHNREAWASTVKTRTIH